MARVTVEDCLEEVENRFALVMLASARCRELRKNTGPPRLFESGNKTPVHSLREVAAGFVDFDQHSKEKLRQSLKPDELQIEDGE